MLRNLNQSAAGKRILGTPRVGILAAQILAETATGDNGPGILYNEAQQAEYVGKHLRARVLNFPPVGTLFVYENGAVEASGLPNGTHLFTYEMDVDGVAQPGTADFEIQVGAINASADGGSGSGTGSGAGGAATGQVSASADGGSGTSTGSGSGGDSSGGTGGSATASGGTGTGVGSGTGGTATGGTSDATATGGTGTGTGSGSGGTAYGASNTIPPGSPCYRIATKKRNYTVKKMTLLPAKDPAERKIIEFDFSRDASAITSATITATVAQGKKDATPQAIIDGSNTPVGALVRQFVAGGQLGTTYDLRCVGLDADGEIHVAVGRLPVQRAEP